MNDKITPDNFESTYVDPIEEERIDKFVCDEMARQIHRYIKAMSGTKHAMLMFEERIAHMSVPEKEQAIARYIDLNRKVLSGLDFKIVLARAMANYCDTFAYLLRMVNDKRKAVYYLNRIKSKYMQYHEIFEQDGKFGMKDYKGNVLISPQYDFLRTCYVYMDDLSIMPATAPSIVIVAMFIHQFGLDHLLFHQLRVDEGELRGDRYPLISENGFYIKQFVHPAVVFYTLGLTGERLAITLHELVLAYAQLHLLRTETAAGLQRAARREQHQYGCHEKQSYIHTVIKLKTIIHPIHSHLDCKAIYFMTSSLTAGS